MRDESPAPPNIPDYELLREIGRGSYGVVWLARSVTGLYRAVKIVWRSMFEDAQPYEREFRGIREFAAVSLVAPRQLALLHVGRNDAVGFFYYVMELADDVETGREIDPLRYAPKTLKEAKVRQPRFTIADTIKLGVELAEGLAELHQRKLVHRDIKPSNIIYVGGAVKLADIGLVTAARNSDQTVTRVGNPGYMPPDFPGTPSADVYGVGKVLYELATGRDRDDFPALPDLAELPDRKELLELNEVLLRACSWKTEERFDNAQALLEEFHLLQAGKSVRRLRATERHLSRALKAAAILAIAAVLAGAGAWAAWQQAKKEMALRAEAERQRDELARRRTYSGNLASAQATLSQGNLLGARQLLAELLPKPNEEDLRGVEWRALWHQAHGSPRKYIRTADQLEIDRLALSPDESLLATRDKSNTLTLYNTETGEKNIHINGLWAFAGFSPDGKWVIGTDPSLATHRWSTKDGSRDEGSRANIGIPLHAIDSSTVLSIPRERPLRLSQWDFEQKSEKTSLSLAMDPPDAAWAGLLSEINSDRSAMLRAWIKGSGRTAEFQISYIRLSPTRQIIHQNLGEHIPSAIGFGLDGPWVFATPANSRTQGNLWRLIGDRWVKTDESLSRQTTKLDEISHSDACRSVAACLRELQWLDAANNPISISRGHTAPITDMVVSRKHRRVFSADSAGALISWPLETPPATTYQISPPTASGALKVVFSPDGESLWLPDAASGCIELDVKNLQLKRTISDLRLPLAVTNGEIIGHTQNKIVAVNLATGDRRSVVDLGQPIKLSAVSFSADKTAILTTKGELWIQDREHLTRIAGELDRAYSLVFQNDGSHLWIATRQGNSVLCIDTVTHREIWRVSLPTTASAILPMADKVIVGTSNGHLEFLELATGKKLRPNMNSGSAEPLAITLSSDRKRLIVGGSEGSLHYFDASRWEAIHSQPVSTENSMRRLDMASSPDGATLAVLTAGGSLYVVRTR